MNETKFTVMACASSEREAGVRGRRVEEASPRSGRRSPRLTAAGRGLSRNCRAQLWVLSLVLSAATLGVGAQWNCVAIDSRTDDTWCNSNCNHVPSYCPPGWCQCETTPHRQEGATTSTASTASAAQVLSSTSTANAPFRRCSANCEDGFLKVCNATSHEDPNSPPALANDRTACNTAYGHELLTEYCDYGCVPTPKMEIVRRLDCIGLTQESLWGRATSQPDCSALLEGASCQMPGDGSSGACERDDQNQLFCAPPKGGILDPHCLEDFSPCSLPDFSIGVCMPLPASSGGFRVCEAPTTCYTAGAAPMSTTCLFSSGSGIYNCRRESRTTNSPIKWQCTAVRRLSSVKTFSPPPRRRGSGMVGEHNLPLIKEACRIAQRAAFELLQQDEEKTLEAAWCADNSSDAPLSTVPQLWRPINEDYGKISRTPHDCPTGSSWQGRTAEGWCQNEGERLSDFGDLAKGDLLGCTCQSSNALVSSANECEQDGTCMWSTNLGATNELGRLCKPRSRGRYYAALSIPDTVQACQTLANMAGPHGEVFGIAARKLSSTTSIAATTTTTTSALLPTTTAAPPSTTYIEVTWGGSCEAVGAVSIQSLSVCSAAATVLELPDTSAVDDGQSGVAHDPRGCYSEGGEIKFNQAGTNTGRCSASNRCICAAAGHGHILVTSGQSCEAAGADTIRSLSDCSAAASAIFSAAVDDGQSGFTWQSGYDPRGCYFEGGEIKFNQAGTNTGRCSASNRCICAAAGHGHILVTSGQSCEAAGADTIRSLSDCSAAASAIFSAAVDDGQSGFTWQSGYDPRGCYFEGGEIKFNQAGTNTGWCGRNSDSCICLVPGASTTTTSTPAPTFSQTINPDLTESTCFFCAPDGTGSSSSNIPSIDEAMFLTRAESHFNDPEDVPHDIMIQLITNLAKNAFAGSHFGQLGVDDLTEQTFSETFRRGIQDGYGIISWLPPMNNITHNALYRSGHYSCNDSTTWTKRGSFEDVVYNLPADALMRLLSAPAFGSALVQAISAARAQMDRTVGLISQTCVGEVEQFIASASCAHGMFKSSSDACEDCPAGRYGESKSLVGEKQCTPCPAGYYSSTIGLSEGQRGGQG